MKILVVGSGGREHAIVWKLAQSPRKPTLYCAPGNAGVESLATCVPIDANDLAGLKAFVQSEQIDLTVVGPEAPLALGIVDEFRTSKLKVFGPTKGAARIEASKVFSKEIMDRAKIRTANAQSFDQAAPALAYLDQHELPVVVKADGLAQGKGVVVASTREEAKQAVRDLMEQGRFGQAGQRVLIEQFLVSYLTLSSVMFNSSEVTKSNLFTTITSARAICLSNKQVIYLLTTISSASAICLSNKQLIYLFTTITSASAICLSNKQVIHLFLTSTQ